MKNHIYSELNALKMHVPCNISKCVEMGATAMHVQMRMEDLSIVASANYELTRLVDEVSMNYPTLYQSNGGFMKQRSYFPKEKKGHKHLVQALRDYY